MKYFIYLTVSVFLIASFVIVLNLPLRSLEPLLSKYFPEISYSNIEGSVWSGKITDLTFANEYLG
jgi:hypothetical protein